METTPSPGAMRAALKIGHYATTEAVARIVDEETHAGELLEACQYVVKWHREHDGGEGELYGLDFVTTCIGAIRRATRGAR